MKTKIEIKSIAYSKRYNIGNYESEEFKAEGSVDGDPIEGFAQLKGAVYAAADAEAIPWPVKGVTKSTSKSNPVDDESGESDEEEKPKKKATKKAAKKVEPEDVEEDEDEEEIEEEDPEEDDEESEESDDEEGDEEETEKPKGAKGSKIPTKATSDEPKKKSLKKKGSVYTRDSDLHKKLFVEEMKKVSKTFLKDFGDKAKAISIKLDGKEFLDADGAVLESFTESLKKMMKGSK